MIHVPHDHDLGLQHDLDLMQERLQERRRLLGWLVGGSAAMIAGCGGGDDAAATTSTGAASTTGTTTSGSTTTTSGATSCPVAATETAGPYPADGSNAVNGAPSNVLIQSGVVRSDIRASFGASTNVASGVPLELTLTLLNSNNSCNMLAGYAVYLWHCTREGGYSLYSNGILDETYLRGVQVADANGQVTFKSIFPGCYAGRYPHIHFEIYPSLAAATLYTNKVLTSQIALPRDICSAVYGGASGYSQSVSNLAQVTLSNDNVFGDNTTAQIAAMTLGLTGSVAAGYAGTLMVGVPGY